MMSDFHDYKGVTRMDFDCATDVRKEVVVQMPSDPDELRQSVCIVVFTNKGISLEVYEDGELVRTSELAYQEDFGIAK
jgi:hypothetical protein